MPATATLPLVRFACEEWRGDKTITIVFSYLWSAPLPKPVVHGFNSPSSASILVERSLRRNWARPVRRNHTARGVACAAIAA